MGLCGLWTAERRSGNGGTKTSACYASGASSALIGLLMVGLSGRGLGATAEGTLITNVASATYASAQAAAYGVSFATTAFVMVVNPAIAVQKTSAPTVACSGSTVTFCIWATNTSAMTSAFNVVVSDRMPDVFGYVLGGQSLWATGTAGATVTPGFSNVQGIPQIYCWPTTVNPMCNASGEPLNGQGGPYYIRWAISVIGPGKSAMACFKAYVL